MPRDTYDDDFKPKAIAPQETSFFSGTMGSPDPAAATPAGDIDEITKGQLLLDLGRLEMDLALAGDQNPQLAQAIASAKSDLAAGRLPTVMPALEKALAKEEAKLDHKAYTGVPEAGEDTSLITPIMDAALGVAGNVAANAVITPITSAAFARSAERDNTPDAPSPTLDATPVERTLRENLVVIPKSLASLKLADGALDSALGGLGFVDKNVVDLGGTGHFGALGTPDVAHGLVAMAQGQVRQQTQGEGMTRTLK